MPVSFLSEAERLSFNSFPKNLSTDALIAYFTLSENDLRQILRTTTPTNRLGFALRLLLLRFLGFHLSDFTSVPPVVFAYVASQVDAEPSQLEHYAERVATRTVHQRAIKNYLGFRLPSDQDLQTISEWLVERALEHDRPSLLLQLLCERLLAEKFVRPGFSVIERMVATARNESEEEIFRRVESIIKDVLVDGLDELLLAEQPNRPTPLAVFRQSATSNSPKTILVGLDKLAKLQKWQVGSWNLSAINPNRRKQLAQIGFRSTAQALSRMNKTRRYPILLAFLLKHWMNWSKSSTDCWRRFQTALTANSSKSGRKSHCSLAIKSNFFRNWSEF